VAVDAIVNPSNESLTSRHGVSYDIFARAGAQLDDAVAALDGCKTGHAKLTPAFDLPSTYSIVHLLLSLLTLLFE
jgi:O-acetyl-ADP-ribose deacetylase (regulator of RNase III)